MKKQFISETLEENRRSNEKDAYNRLLIEPRNICYKRPIALKNYIWHAIMKTS